MSSITRFRTELRIKVDSVEADHYLLEFEIAQGGPNAEKRVREHLEHLERQLASKRPYQGKAQSILRLGREKAQTDDDRSRRTGFKELNDAYNRAWAAMDLAAVALDEAAHAALEAWLAETRMERASAEREEPRDPKHDE